MSLLKTVELEEATGEIAQIYNNLKENMGMVPNVVKLFSTSPALLKSQMNYVGYFMQHSALDNVLNAYIRLIVSVRGKCEYCTKFSTALLLQNEVSQDDINDAIDNPEKINLDEKRKALFLAAIKVVENPSAIDSQTIAVLKDLGWTEENIFDAFHHAANQSGIINIISALKTEVDF